MKKYLNKTGEAFNLRVDHFTILPIPAGEIQLPEHIGDKFWMFFKLVEEADVEVETDTDEFDVETTDDENPKDDEEDSLEDSIVDTTPDENEPELPVDTAEVTENELKAEHDEVTANLEDAPVDADVLTDEELQAADIKNPEADEDEEPEQFNWKTCDDKDELDAFAKAAYGIDLDRRNSLTNMKADLEEQLSNRE